MAEVLRPTVGAQQVGVGQVEQLGLQIWVFSQVLAVRLEVLGLVLRLAGGERVRPDGGDEPEVVHPPGADVVEVLLPGR
eukprot:6847379-Heterocapsa_arctica.AAC.1